MSELLLNWLNNEIELSKPVTNFEKDFANGYLFGELLYKFNQQSNFKEFSKKDNVPAKIDNFNMLMPTLRNLKVKFDSKMIDNIMKEQRGIALQLLYQLKMSLEKVYPPTDIAVLRKTGKMGDNQPALKIAHSKEKYDEHAQTFFQQRLQVLNKPQKTLNMEKHLEKFDQEKDRQENITKKYHQDEVEAQEKMRQEIRRAQINKLQRNAGFMEEWQQKGIEDWKKNQQIKKEREKRTLEFEYKQAEKFNNVTMRKINDATREVSDGIDQFEQSLKKIGINPKVRKDEAERAVSESLQNSPLKSSSKGQRFASMTKPGATSGGPLGLTLGAGTIGSTQRLGLGMTTQSGALTLTSTGLKTKDKKTVTEKVRMERERRRRKMIVDQAKTHNDMEQKLKEAQIVERMKRQAKQEKELEYEKWRTEQCKNVIIENRKLREARYEKRRELDQQNAIWREEEMLRSLQGQIDREITTFRERDFEMRIAHKQAQRERRNNFGQMLFDSIFDIANEAYVHMQKQDSDQIDSRNQHEWLQLFIEQLPIQGSLSRLSELKEEIDDNDQQYAEIYENLDSMELEDYLKNAGQWPQTLITENPPNLEHFLTGQTDAPAGSAPAKGAKAPAAKQAVEQIQLEEGDTELPGEAPNNYLLGDALELIINLNFEARAKYRRPKVPSYLNLKLCIIGYAFAGKKSQAQKLKELYEKYGFNIFQMNELVQEALEFYESHPEPISQPQYEEQIDDQEDPDMSADSEQSESYNAEEDFRQCGQDVQQHLIDGSEVPDELYVKIFVSKLRMAFPYKNKQTQRRELREKVQREKIIRQKLDELNKELNGEEVNQEGSRKKKKRDSKQIQKDIDQLNQELEQLLHQEMNGFILVDFPTTPAQAKLLETALSGYIPPKEEEKIDREAQIEDAYLLVQPSAKEEPPMCLIKSGLDAVIWLETSREECMRRALGRRFDSVNEKMYHIQDQPPLTTNAPLCERLTPMDVEEESEATLIDRWLAFDQHGGALEKWLKQFGKTSKKGQDFDYLLLNKVNGDGDAEHVFQNILSVLDRILTKKQKVENKLKSRILDRLIQQEADEQARLQAKREEEEAQRKREEEGGDQEQEQQHPKKEEQPKVQKPEPATEKIGTKEPSPDNLDADFNPVLMKIWQQLSSNYKAQMKKVFSLTRIQRERMIEQFSQIQQNFLQFLHRPDLKQEKLDQFIKDFNDFSDQYPDLREDEQTKDELHQRVDILSDELWEIIEERKEQHIEERKKIMESGFVEYELGFLVQCSQLLMQSEVDKFKSSVQLLHDYYHAYEDKLIPEAPQCVTQEIVQENEELPPVETLPEGADQNNSDLYQYPRLDKLFEKALKTQVVPDVTQQALITQDKKGAPAQKGKDPKKVVEEEKPAEESQYVKDMKEAIKVEKQILRFRLTQIRNWTLKKLRETRQKAIQVYQKIEDWIIVSNKAENDAVEEMCTVIKRAIEEETKIQDELRLKFMDFSVDEKIMNFIIPPPEKLPAMEEVRSERFNIVQLTTLVEELEALALQHSADTNYIPNKAVYDFLLRKLENSKSLGDEGSLPEEWRSYSEFEFQKIIRSLDKFQQGVIDWKVLATCIILLKSTIINEKQIEAYKKELEANGDSVSYDSFIKAQAWFDETEASKDRDYSIPYTRQQYIKELLFRVHKSQNGDISQKKFFKNLKLKELTMFKRNIKTYHDILLPQTEQ